MVSGVIKRLGLLALGLDSVFTVNEPVASRLPMFRMFVAAFLILVVIFIFSLLV